MKSKFKRLKPPLCKCGCGQSVRLNSAYKKWNKFLQGHHSRVNNPMDNFLSRQKVSKTLSGHKVSEETRFKISEGNKGKLAGKSHHMFGKTHTDEAKRKISEAGKRLKHTDETKRKISIANKGKVISLDQRRKISNTLTGRKRPEISGANNSNWKGGISCEPYCDAWLDQEYKQSIRDRDNNQCQNPDCWGTSNRIHIHHINYIKKDCNPYNLITLCNSCNSRANYKRGFWMRLYQNIMFKKYDNSYEKKGSNS